MKRYILLNFVLLTLVISGCGVKGRESPITPSPDRPTFLYFYTDR